MRPGTEALAARTDTDLAPVPHVALWNPDEIVDSESTDVREMIFHIFEENDSFEEASYVETQENEGDRRVRTKALLHDPFLAYVNSLGDLKLLDPVEERELLVRAKNGDLEARHRIIMSNLRLVIHIARRKLGRGLALEDLIQQGNLGLIEGIDAFELEHNTRISTYICPRIRSSMQKAFADQSFGLPLPKHIPTAMNVWRDASIRLSHELGRAPSTEEILAATDLQESHDSLRKASVIVDGRPVQVDYRIEGEDGNVETVEPADEWTDQPSVAAEANDDIRFLEISLGKLFDRHRDVIRLRYGLDDNEPKTLDETATILNVSRETVRNDEKAAIQRLKELAGVDLPGGSL